MMPDERLPSPAPPDALYIGIDQAIGTQSALSEPSEPSEPSELSVPSLADEPRIVLGPPSKVSLVIKRTLDIVLSVVLLLIFMPAIIAIGIAIKLSSPGPALFRQVRVGRNGRRFRIVKFRSMTADAEDRLATDVELRGRHTTSGHKLAADEDPRITALGRVLRRTSIDELPQLWNVLSGSMSLVGPRPIVPAESTCYEDRYNFYISVKPGITGYWQVNGRSAVQYPQRADLDVFYACNWSNFLDLRILARTVVEVIRRTGAY